MKDFYLWLSKWFSTLRETSFTLTFKNFLKIALSICKIFSTVWTVFILSFFFQQPYLQVDNYLCLLKANWKCQRQSLKPVDLFKWFITSYCLLSHDVTKIQTTKLSILLRFYFYSVLEQLKINFQTNFRFKRVLGFVIEYPWISKLLRDAALTWLSREQSFRLKKWLFRGILLSKQFKC